ncbi:MAG TPA: ABC transporter ATP-binding protein [Actinomycetota bacterium]|nr:ABC transporter ATP-binding protein [Actinomycetota bacterium]
MPLLELTDVHIHYGGIEAVKGISLRVEPSEIVTMIGANGAGKTTTLKTISGLKRPTTGSIVFQGQRIDGMPAHKIVGMGIGHAPEGRRIFGRMTVRENLEMGLYAAADGKDDRGVKRQHEQEALERVYSLFPILRERASQRGGTLSGGEQQMLAIGRALMTRPEVLMLDEPSMGLAPMLVEKIFEIIREISEQGTTILLIEQNAHMALNVAHRGYVIESGNIVLEDSSQALLGNDEVRKAYLGEE